MKVRLINASNYSIIDQFELNKSLADTIKYLNEKYDGTVVCEGGIVNYYVNYVRG